MRWLRSLLRRSPRTLSSIQAYTKWAASYAAHAHNPLMALEQEAMLKLMPSLTNRVVLDLACGTGRYGLIAQQRGAKHVVGLDNSAAMLKAAQIADVALATTAALPLSAQSIDVVLCGLALGHLPQIETSLCEISRVLQAGGIALISDFHPYQYLSGARRTFKADDGRVYNVEHYVHLTAEYHHAGHAAGLRLTGLLEPGFNADIPVVLVMRFEK